MWWQYVLVFFGAMLMDVTPFPLPPAFTMMIFLQIKFDLPIWPVVAIGVAGSIFGRYVLTLYIPLLSSRLFSKEKHDDIQFLGDKMKRKGWKSQVFIAAYSLLPLPTTPLFIAAGMARMHPIFLIPAFFIGKFSSDAAAVTFGKFAAENTADLLQGALSWKSITGLVVGGLMIGALLFVDWRTLLQHKKFVLRFDIWNSKKKAPTNPA